MAEMYDRPHPIYPDRLRGAEQPIVRLLEYGDYQCPQCIRAHELITAILQEYGDRLQFIFRHFPLTDINPQAHHAAEAAAAAGSQGKFWEMHDRLFAESQALDDASLVEHAIALRLNVNQFLQEIADDRHEARIAANLAQGKSDGVQIPPTFFINQKRFEGSWSNSKLMHAIQILLELPH